MQNYSIDDKRFFLHHGENKKRLSPKMVADLGGVSIKTAYKWIAGTQTPHADTIELMKTKAFGLIFGLPDWCFIDGLLWCEGYNRPFLPHSLHIMAMLTQRQNLIDDNRVADANRIAQLEQELKNLNDQFLKLEQVAPRDFTQETALFAGFQRERQRNSH